MEVDNVTYIDHFSKHTYITASEDHTFYTKIHKDSIPKMITDQEKLEYVHS